MTIDPMDQLRRLSSDSANAMEIGKAAEHLVCADLIMRGFTAYLSDQGLPYDVVVDTGSGSLLRVQVKGTCFPKNVVSLKYEYKRLAYSFAVRKRGKNGSKRLHDSDCDIIALVALDIKTIAYFPTRVVGQTVQLCPVGVKSEQGWLRDISQFPFEDCLDPNAEFNRIGRNHVDSCINGHNFKEVGYSIVAGRRRCKICSRESSARMRENNKSKLDPIDSVLG